MVGWFSIISALCFFLYTFFFCSFNTFLTQVLFHSGSMAIICDCWFIMHFPHSTRFLSLCVYCFVFSLFLAGAKWIIFSAPLTTHSQQWLCVFILLQPFRLRLFSQLLLLLSFGTFASVFSSSNFILLKFHLVVFFSTALVAVVSQHNPFSS